MVKLQLLYIYFFQKNTSDWKPYCFSSLNGEELLMKLLMITELLRLNHTQFICPINFTNKKVGNQKK